VLSLQLRLLLVAVQFYSRIPVTGRLADWVGFEPAWLARATRYFPLVGVLVASLTAFVYAMCGLWLPHGVALLLAMAAGLLLTGAFHEDGFADFCDGFGGGTTAERTLEIMHDSRIGAYGAIGVAMLLLLRFATLESVDPSWIGVTLATAAAFSRGCSVLVMATLPYARVAEASKAKPVAQHLAPTDTGIGLALAALPAAAAAWWTGAPGVFASAAALALAATFAMRRIVRRRLAGYTGDCLGAVQQVAEVAFFVGLVAALSGLDEMPAEPAY
jgi:adenosylcobinamide-GDP ribazoletransferase